MCEHVVACVAAGGAGLFSVAVRLFDDHTPFLSGEVCGGETNRK